MQFLGRLDSIVCDSELAFAVEVNGRRYNVYHLEAQGENITLACRRNCPCFDNWWEIAMLEGGHLAETEVRASIRGSR